MKKKTVKKDESNNVMRNWITLINKMLMLFGMMGSFISGTVASGDFIKNLLGDKMLSILLIFEIVFLAIFAIILVILFLKSIQDNIKD